MKGIKASDAVQCPLALSWMLSSLTRMLGENDRRVLLNQAEALMEEAVASRKLRKDWSQYGVIERDDYLGGGE